MERGADRYPAGRGFHAEAAGLSGERDLRAYEHQTTGTVPGEFLGVPGNGRRVSFRMLHVFEFRDGCISRGNVWLDGGAIALTDVTGE